MSRPRFQWDPQKAQSNLRKHGIDFASAINVFADPFSINELDHSEADEHRWRVVGDSGGFTIMLVAYAIYDAENDIEIYRIISARRADRTERRRYERGRFHHL